MSPRTFVVHNEYSNDIWGGSQTLDHNEVKECSGGWHYSSVFFILRRPPVLVSTGTRSITSLTQDRHHRGRRGKGRKEIRSRGGPPGRNRFCGRDQSFFLDYLQLLNYQAEESKNNFSLSSTPSRLSSSLIGHHLGTWCTVRSFTMKSHLLKKYRGRYKVCPPRDTDV